MLTYNLQVCLYSNLMGIWAPFASGFTTTNIGNTNPERLNPAWPVRPWPTSSGDSPQKYPKVKWGPSTKPTLALTYGFAEWDLKKKQDPPAYSIIFPLQSSKHVGSFWGIPWHPPFWHKSTKIQITYILYNYVYIYIPHRHLYQQQGTRTNAEVISECCCSTPLKRP
jgi:hypothetical protein